MNKVILTGRLTKEIELKSSTSGMSFTQNGIAVDRRGKEKETDFFNLTAFGKTAEFMDKWLHKGSKVVVVGHLQTDSYTDKSGNKKTSVSVIVDEIEFGESKGEGQKEEKKNDFMNIPETLVEELPFS